MGDFLEMNINEGHEYNVMTFFSGTRNAYQVR
jgi:hypothetical protein